MPVIYRVVKRRHPLYDAGGAEKVGGRWTSPGVAAVYTSEHYATAILEVLVHRGRLALPGAHPGMAIHILDDFRIERFDPAASPGWELEGSTVARRRGDAWFAAARTPVLAVPSVPGQPAEWNFIINPAHPDAGRIRPLDPFGVAWDGRLFGPATGIVRTAP